MQDLEEWSREEGCDCIGITSPQAIPQASERLRVWLEQGCHATMAWMENRASQRANPELLWPEVRSIIMLGLNYAPRVSPLEGLHHHDRGLISAYAQGRDYHDIFKPALKRIARRLVSARQCDVKVFVDTAPVMEKPLAQAAGLGWQGKHTNLVSKQFGSWLFLGAIYTTLDLPLSKPQQDHCGSCRACLDICPTQAFPEPYRLDARRCISYLTIEHKGAIPEDYRAAIGNRIYGCDDCLAVCPWNKFARESHVFQEFAGSGLHLPPLRELLKLTEETFRKTFARTPIKRIGHERFLRNVLIAVGNSKDQSMLADIEPFLDDSAPVIRDTARWAKDQLDPPPKMKA